MTIIGLVELNSSLLRYGIKWRCQLMWCDLTINSWSWHLSAAFIYQTDSRWSTTNSRFNRTQTIKLMTIPQKTTVECDFKTDHSVDSITIGPSLSYIRRWVSLTCLIPTVIMQLKRSSNGERKKAIHSATIGMFTIELCFSGFQGFLNTRIEFYRKTFK